ncbi:hypothetical protein HZA40_02530, partial [Candidatus Peregrinibacteria bacterium]|nr:hypothetical protein [Candidatus Peregrinibacteria bacterium]
KCWLRLVPDNIVDSLCNSNVSAGSSYIAFLSGGIWRMTLEGNTDLNLDTSPTITNNKFLMYVDGSGYSYIKNAGAVASKFYRGIKFTNIAADNSQATYTVSVQWKDGAKTRTLDKTITLYNYL